jgi:hypothetical protein
MTRNINITSLAVFILLTSTLSVHGDQTEYQKLIERIDTINELINQASNTNGLWRETKNFSEAARKHVEAENFILANESLIEAEFQAKQGIQQALEQTDISTLIPSYLRH